MGITTAIDRTSTSKSMMLGLEDFLGAARVFWRVSKDIVLSNTLDIMQGKQIRRLRESEVVEEIVGPSIDKTVGVTRIQVHTLCDDIVGWATIQGTKGNVFLQRGGTALRVKEVQ